MGLTKLDGKPLNGRAFQWRRARTLYSLLLFWLVSVGGAGVVARTVGQGGAETGFVVLVAMCAVVLSMATHRGGWSTIGRVLYVVGAWLGGAVMGLPAALLVAPWLVVAGRTHLVDRSVAFLGYLPFVVYALWQSRLFVAQAGNSREGSDSPTDVTSPWTKAAAKYMTVLAAALAVGVVLQASRTLLKHGRSLAQPDVRFQKGQASTGPEFIGRLSRQEQVSSILAKWDEVELRLITEWQDDSVSGHDWVVVASAAMSELRQSHAALARVVESTSRRGGGRRQDSLDIFSFRKQAETELMINRAACLQTIEALIEAARSDDQERQSALTQHWNYLMGQEAQIRTRLGLE